MAPIRKNFFLGIFAFAYLVLGTGSGVVKTPKADPKRDTAAFAATLPRKIYRYSVVPGGVFTPEELAAARRADPVVAAHYADFGKDTRIIRLLEDQFAYISYRKGDKIYYSKKKHKVCKGELVITDGKNYARTRCANRISKVFKAPTQIYDEPSPPRFDEIEPPGANVPTPDDPLLTGTYYNFPGVPPYSQEPPLQTGANPGPNPRPGYPESGSEVILPQFLPLGGVAPALFAPLAAGTGGGGTGGGGGGTGGGGGVTPIPEPVEWPLLLTSLALFSFWRVKKTQRS